MKKKSSASSQHERVVRTSAERILREPLTRPQKSDLARLKKQPDARIDYSDIPPLTLEQLSGTRRPAKKLVAVRLDPDVFSWLQQQGSGYSTRINYILRAVMTHQQGR